MRLNATKMKVGIVGFGSFGQFAASVLAPHAEVLVWGEPAVGEDAEACLEFCERELGLNSTRISPQQHDRVMAYVYVLTFFVARSLGRMDMPYIPFKTSSFNELMDLIHLDSKHSDELFATIQRGNPFAGMCARRFCALPVSWSHRLIGASAW